MSTYTLLHRPKVYLWTGSDLRADRVDIGPDLLSMSYSKTLDQPAGSFNLTLLARQTPNVRLGRFDYPADLYRRDLLNAPVSLGIDQPGGITIGLVSHIEESMARSGVSGPAQHTLQISGQDLGKALVQDNVIRAGLNLSSEQQNGYLTGIGATLGTDSPFYASFLDVLGPVSKYDPDAAPTFKGASIQDVVDWCLQKIGSMRIPILGAAFGGDGLLASYIRTTDSVVTGYDERVFNDGLSTYQGNVWGFLRQVLDPDLYELRIDCKPAFSDGVPLPHLVIRPKPFDAKRWMLLDAGAAYGITWDELRTFVERRTHHVVEADQVLNASFSRSDGDVYNHYQVIAKQELIGNAEAAQRGLNYPVTDVGSVKRFGARSMQAHLSLLGGDVERVAGQDSAYAGELPTEVRRHRNRLLNWHRWAPFWEHAQVTVIGRDEFRVGDPVFLPWRQAYLASAADRDGGADMGMRYYCTGVSYSYSPGGSSTVGPYTCTLTLERGHNDALLRAAREILARGADPRWPDNLVES